MASPLRTREVPAIDGRDPFRIEFYKDPYHHYRMGPLGTPLTINAHKVPSVTQGLGILDKSGPLVGWATRVDVDAARRMATETWVRCTNYGKGKDGCDVAGVPITAADLEPGSACATCSGRLRVYRLPDVGWKLQRDIRLAGLDHNTIVGDAQLRGTAIHTLHEEWVDEGKLPKPTDYPEAWRGYVQSYARFLMWAQSQGVSFEVAEVLVGSRRYGFAGTCDTVAITTGADGERIRWDFKTSAECYRASHFPQLAAYELGAVECGDEATDRQGIVLLREDGAFNPDEHIHYSTASGEDFLAALAAFKSQKPLRDADDKAYKARKKAGK